MKKGHQSYTRRQFLATGSAVIASGTIGIDSNITTKKGSDSSNKLILLGTQGGPFVKGYKPGPPASVIIYNSVPFIVDAGYGVTFKLIDAGINLASLRYIFITHHHSDHNLELGPLLYNAWIAGLKDRVSVFGPIGVKALLDFYWESNRFDIETRIDNEGRPDIRTLVTAIEINEGGVLSTNEVSVKAMKNIHPPVKESYAYKFNIGNKIVVFSGDTAYCPALGKFAEGADYLVHEVMYGPAVDKLVERRPNAPKLKESILSHHTLAEDVGRIASMAKVKTLVLNHFVPSDDKSLTDPVWLNAVRSTFKGNIVIGKDLMELPM